MHDCDHLADTPRVNSVPGCPPQCRRCAATLRLRSGDPVINRDMLQAVFSTCDLPRALARKYADQVYDLGTAEVVLPRARQLDKVLKDLETMGIRAQAVAQG